MAYFIDTVAAIRDLENAGIEHRQAEAIIGAIARAQEGLATKSDIAELQARMDAMEARMVAGLADLRADSTAGLADLRASGATGVNKVILSVIAIAGLLFAALKLFD